MDLSIKVINGKILIMSRLRISHHKTVTKIARTMPFNRKLRKIQVALVRMVKILTRGLMTKSWKKKDWKMLKLLMMMKIWIKFKEIKLNSNISRCNMSTERRWSKQLKHQVLVPLQVKPNSMILLRSSSSSSSKTPKTLNLSQIPLTRQRLNQLILISKEKALKS